MGARILATADCGWPTTFGTVTPDVEAAVVGLEPALDGDGLREVGAQVEVDDGFCPAGDLVGVPAPEDRLQLVTQGVGHARPPIVGSAPGWGGGSPG